MINMKIIMLNNKQYMKVSFVKNKNKTIIQLFIKHNKQTNKQKINKIMDIKKKKKNEIKQTYIFFWDQPQSFCKFSNQTPCTI